MLTNSDPTFCPDLLPIPLRVYFPKQLNRALHYRPPRVSLNIQYRRSDNLSKQRFHEVHLEFRISFTEMQLNSRITIIEDSRSSSSPLKIVTIVLITTKSISIVLIKKYFLILLILICLSVGLREHSLSWIPISASH